MRFGLLLCAFILCIPAFAETVYSDSFEGNRHVPWHNTWGPVEISSEQVQDGGNALKMFLDDKYGLSVYHFSFPTYPNTTYRASAWVYVPSQEKMREPMISFVRPDWNILANATTSVRDQWVKLEIELVNPTEPVVYLALNQIGQAPGFGNAVMYYDNIKLEREIKPMNPQEGVRINPFVIEGLDITTTGGMEIHVAPGKMSIDGKVVEVNQETVFTVAGPQIIPVRDEQSILSADEPKSWNGGTALQKVTIEGIGLADSLIPESLIVKAEPGPGGRKLVEGKDWRADKQWARVGRLADGEITGDKPVYLDYDFSLQRMDTIMINSDGTVTLKQGAQRKTIPVPPVADEFSRPLANIWIPARCNEIKPEYIYPIGPGFPPATEEEILAKAALIPKTLEKLNAGEELTVVFWGDSVTCGGTASAPEFAFPQSFTTWLRNRYPKARINYVNAGTGGWSTWNKLPLFEQEVMVHEPDLMIIEFVNDMGMDRETVYKHYTQAINRVREIGGEIIILTPHFVRPEWMPTDNMRTPEIRPTVGYLKEFAAEYNVGLADASRRWAHLWVEGIPYITYEYNNINHPDDRGHKLFVEELQKFFP